MAGYKPKYGPPGTEADYVGSRSRRRRFGQSPSPPRLTDRERVANADVSNRKPPSKPSKGRNRNNLAGQIRSLEKLLKHPNTKMSQIVRQEKGRELAALVLERERKKARLRARKNLGKYHMIRFIERQKCERALKALRKSLEQVRAIRLRRDQQNVGQEDDPGTDDDVDMDDEDGGAKLPSADEVLIEEQIRQAEVDLNYTIYAPLGEKYISLFPATGKEKLAGMSGISKYHLKPEEQAEIRRLKDDNVVRNASGEKPPMWETVRELMEKGTPLEQLRDGKLTSAPITLAQVGGKDEAVQRSKPAAGWMVDDGTIAPEDQDSEDSEFFE